MNATFNATAFVEGLNSFTRTMSQTIGVPLPDMIRQNARAVCKQMANKTQPWGLSNREQLRGSITAQNDIHRAYKTPGELYQELKTRGRANKGGNIETIAKAFYSAVSTNDFEKARGILTSSGIDQRGKWSSIHIGPFDGGAAHNRARDGQTGRVPRDATPGMMITPESVASFVEYKKQVLGGEVGTAKAAWAECAKQLGSAAGFPSYLKALYRGRGIVEDRAAREGYVRIIARVSYMSAILSLQSIAEAGAEAERRMIKFVLTKLAKMQKAAKP